MNEGAFLIRVLTSLVLVPVVLVLIWFEPLRPVLSVVIAAFAGIGLYEYYAIVRARKIQPETIVGIVFGTLLALSGHTGQPLVVGFFLFLAVTVVGAFHMFRPTTTVESMGVSIFGLVYVGWLFAHFSMLRAEPKIGSGVALLILVTVVFTDAGAYICGKLFGRHKLAPKLSPKKTWEGSIGGLVLSIGGACVLFALSDRYIKLPHWSLPHYILIVAVLSAVSQLGDLLESAMKRSAGIKDSGVLFPGHGGVLDRCDGYLFAAPLLYYIVVFSRTL